MKRAIAPSRQQRIWHDWLASQGCYICGSSAEVHHCVGSSGRHQKIHIGQDFCAPLCPGHHRGPSGIHGDRSAFKGQGLGETRKEIEKAIFRRLVAHYRRQKGELPCSAEVLAAIEGWHR